MIPWSLTALTINNVLPIAITIKALFVIGYDDDGGYGVGGDDDVDLFYVLPDALSKVVVFIFVAIKL